MCIEGVPMTNEVIFSLKIEQELHAEFISEAEALQMSATQIIHNFMREFIQRQREPRLHDLLKRKVEAGRKSMQADLGCSNEDVEALFAKRRNGAVNG